MTELEELSIKILVQRERIISLAKQIELLDRIIEQKILILEQDINNKISSLNQQLQRTINQISKITGVSEKILCPPFYQ